MAGERVYFVVPFRIRFSPIGMSGWVKGALPVFWHHWSEATDIRRMPLDRRWSVLWHWWINRPQTMAVPLEQFKLRQEAIGPRHNRQEHQLQQGQHLKELIIISNLRIKLPVQLELVEFIGHYFSYSKPIRIDDLLTLVL